MKGYINVDFPQEHHIEGTKITADIHADILRMKYEPSIEIRSNHVFEHFGYVESLVLLAKWANSLRLKGVLFIGIPDIERLCQAMNSDKVIKQFRVIRYMFGDQGAHWAFHINGWTPNTLAFVLEKLGFQKLSIKRRGNTNSDFPNCSIDFTYIKQKDLVLDTLVMHIKNILRMYLNCNPSENKESPLYDCYCKQVDNLIGGVDG